MASQDASQPDEQHPPEQYLRAEYVVREMAEAGAARVDSLSTARILVLAAMGGGFVTVGALLSVLLAAAVSTPGPARLLEGLGFSAGFYFVILSGAVLFTEANVVLPATLLERGRLISTTPPTDVSSPNQTTIGRALRGSHARNVLADTTSGARKGGPRRTGRTPTCSWWASTVCDRVPDSQPAWIVVYMPRAKWLTTVPSGSVSTMLQNKM